MAGIEQQKLWQDFLDGDQSSFEKLYDQYAAVLYHYGRKFTSDETLIEDAIQDVFLTLWKGRGRLSVPISVRFYLYSSLRRAIYKLLPKLQLCEEGSETESYRQAASPDPSWEEQKILAEHQTERRGQFHHSWKKLSLNQKRAIFLKFYKGMSTYEVANTMGMNKDAIYKLIKRGLLEIRKNILQLLI